MKRLVQMVATQIPICYAGQERRVLILDNLVLKAGTGELGNLLVDNFIELHTLNVEKVATDRRAKGEHNNHQPQAGITNEPRSISIFRRM